MVATKNNIYTPSYFMKRMKDSGFGIWKIFDKYGPHDSRYWTMLIDPGGYSVWVTCHMNREELNEVCFELNDGSIRIPRNFIIKTSSMQTFINNLLQFGIENNETFDSSLININNSNERRQIKTSKEVLQEKTN